MIKEKDEVLCITKVIYDQLLNTTDKNVIYSWGVHDVFSTIFEDKAALGLVVNARLFQGIVLIFYDEGRDYYDIYLLNEEDGQRLLASGVAFDEMGMIIDREIESGDDQEEYQLFCQQECMKLLRGECF